MIALMPSESANSSPGVNGYWYGGRIPDRFNSGLESDASGPRMMRRASEAIVSSAYMGQSPEHPIWGHSQGPLHIDTSEAASLVLRPEQGSLTPQSHRAPLAPKQGLAGGLGGARAQHQSPISGIYALRTPRGKITSIACDSCRKRKSKCDGVRPKCNTCQSKNLSCVYDVAEDGKTTTQLRSHVRRLAKDLDDMKSILSMLVVAPDKTVATSWANELERNGFAHHSAEDIKRSLQEQSEQRPAMPQHSSLDSLCSESFSHPPHSIATSSYEGSSRDDSREESQPTYIQPDGAASFDLMHSNEVGKFTFDCAFYRRSKRALLASGWDETQIFGRNELDIDTILLGFVDPSDAHSLPTWASRTTNKLLPGAPLPLRLASTYLLTKMMRWLIWPSAENMNAMPEWMMPVPRQDHSPFDILIDLLPWPQLRQYLYQHPGEFMVGAFVGSVNLTWPYADDACHYWDIEAGCTHLTPLFESQVIDLLNWTMDAKAMELIPHLDSMIPVKM